MLKLIHFTYTPVFPDYPQEGKVLETLSPLPTCQQLVREE